MQVVTCRPKIISPVFCRIRVAAASCQAAELEEMFSRPDKRLGDFHCSSVVCAAPVQTFWLMLSCTILSWWDS